MQVQLRSRLGLLSRVSTLAIIAAASGGLGIVQQAEAACTTTQTIPPDSNTVSSAKTCVVADGATGDVTVNANVGDPGPGYPSFFVGAGGISGQLIIGDALIQGGHFDGKSRYGALTIYGDVAGGIVNGGQISSATGNAVQIGFLNSGTIINAGTLTGDITNNAGIAGGLNGSGVAALYGTMEGALINGENGVISGGVAGVYIADEFDSWSGGIQNFGSILGTSAGIQIGAMQGGEGHVDFSGGITNEASGRISSANGPAVFISGNEFSGGVWNYGVITESSGGEGQFGGTGVVVNARVANDGIHNFNQITGVGGPGVWVTDNNFQFNGDIENIHNEGGEGAPTISGDDFGVLVNSANWTGNFTNEGVIDGGLVGVGTNYDPFFGKALPGGTITGNFLNDGTITGGNTGALIIADTYNGNFTNNGSITGSNIGVALMGAGTTCDCASSLVAFSLGGGSFTGDITNSGFMSGDTAFFVSYDSVDGDFDNTASGVLQGVTRGLYIDVDDFQGNFTNSGTITASGGEGGTAVQIGSGTEEGSVAGGQTFTGDFTNSGIMHGGSTGLNIVLDSYSGAEGGEGFTNSGTITGDDWIGLRVHVNSWNANFTNEAGGVIEGGNTGAYFNAGSIVGDFTNYGSIIGHALDTGWSINTPSFTGNIVNGVGGLISAPSNALHLQINTFTGQISNAGVIAASSGNAAVLEGYSGNGTYNGAFTNTGSIIASNIGIYLNGSKLTGGIDNNGGTIDGGYAAISTQNATGATTITNEGGGVIIGDVRLSGNYGDSFVGRDGGIRGSIIGAGGEGGEGGGRDDTVVVSNGTHYFVGKGEQLSDLASFTVGKNGAALMGALFEGDTNGSGYSSSNVDAIAVNNSGVLYIDKSTSLNGGTYTQQSGGTLEFYLQAPGGGSFSSLTGDQIAAAGDYGSVHVTGAATLDGAIAAFLDPTFASANSGLTSVTYNDVLVADGGITGDFSTVALISNNSLFELSEVRDTNTVDLTVVRAGGLGQLGDIGGIVIDLGGPWKSVVNDYASGIGSGGCTVGGAGWCFNAYAANEPGGSAVMTDATLDPFEWLRTGQRRAGDTSVWGRAVGVWGDTDGDNVGHFGTDFDTFGGIVGVDHVFTPTFMAGVAAQYTQTDIDFKQLADKANVESFEVGGYMSYGDARFYVNANSSVIFHNIEVTRFVPAGSAHADYDGLTYSAYAEIGRIFETEEGLRIQPLAALSYAHLDTDSYNETGSAPAVTTLHVFDAELDSLKSLLGGRFGYPITLDSGRKFVPEARVIWAHEFMDDHASFLANPISNPLNISRIEGERYSRDSIILGTGFTLPLSDATSIFVDYDASLNNDITTHTVSGGFRSRW